MNQAVVLVAFWVVGLYFDWICLAEGQSSSSLRQRQRTRRETTKERTLQSGTPFRFIFLPDTQIYTWDKPFGDYGHKVTNPGGTLPIFANQTRWIAEHWMDEGMDIHFVSHAGDITQNGDRTYEWERANEAMSILDEAGVPYGTAIGNHDFGGGTNVDNYLQWFGPTSKRFEGKSWYGGASPSGISSYQLIEHEGTGFLFLHLCFANPEFELVWADEVLNDHKDRLVILTTHKHQLDFFVSYGRYSERMKNGVARGITVPELTDARGNYPDKNVGESFYEGFLQRHSNIFLVACGHFSSDYYRLGWNGANLPLIQDLTDYQDVRNGGDGYMRIYEIDIPNNTLFSYSYSSLWNRRRTVIDALADLIEVTMSYSVRTVRDEFGDEVGDLTESFLLAFFQDDLLVHKNVIADHPDYLADPEYYEQLFRDSFRGNVPPRYGTLTDWEAFYLFAFAPDLSDPYGPSIRNPTYELKVQYQDYLTQPVAPRKSVKRIAGEVNELHRGRIERREQIRAVLNPPYFIREDGIAVDGKSLTWEEIFRRAPFAD